MAHPLITKALRVKINYLYNTSKLIGPEYVTQ